MGSAKNRLRSLDGLRGVAAVVVVLQHCVLVLVPQVAWSYFGGRAEDGWPSWITYSPLHLFWMGTEAVYVFFVISGIVLTRMAMSSSFNWRRYYPSRLIRLYGPTILAVVLGSIIILVTADKSVLASRAFQNYTGTYNFNDYVQDFTLIFGISGRIGPLWSLQYEILFSLLLPLYLLLRKVKPWIGVTIVATLIAAGALVAFEPLYYLPFFGLGVIMAQNWEVIVSRSREILSRNKFVGWLALSLSLLLILSHWLVAAWIDNFLVRAITLPFILFGVCLLVVLAETFEPLLTFFSTKIVAWLGIISFSLYLVHEPIIIGAAFLTGGAVWAVALGFVLSFIVAQLFYMALEKPIHKYSQKLRKG